MVLLLVKSDGEISVLLARLNTRLQVKWEEMEEGKEREGLSGVVCRRMGG